MVSSLFTLAAVSPGRQRAFRQAVLAHVLVVSAAAWAAFAHGPGPFLGQILLVAGIVEGATLIGWRLTQLPKSQALEFLLVSDLRPCSLFLAEAAIGICRLALVTLSGLPILLLLTVLGRQDTLSLKPLPPALLPADLLPCLLMPLTWGAITGLGLTVWAYEAPGIRRWGERILLVVIVFYLAVGVVAGENLIAWLAGLKQFGALVLEGFRWFHQYNPFGVLQFWFENYGFAESGSETAWQELEWLQLAALALLAGLLFRGAARLQGHFHELHYKPVSDRKPADCAGIGDQPLAWWAVRRVTRYSGKVNLWLAGGFGLLYALYTVVGPDAWPFGKQAFQIFEQKIGGIPGLATALVVLAAVPAAFQYGLWDANAHDRCRRLELLLLTRLTGRDYWQAAAVAAWNRGRGYFSVAVLLWTAAALAQHADLTHLAELLGSFCAGVVLWGLYFAVGFRAFSRGMQANRLGTLLTLGLPCLAFILARAGWTVLAGLTPPGSVYLPAAAAPSWLWLPGPMLGAVLALLLARRGLNRCEADLRRWYDQHHGRRITE